MFIAPFDKKTFFMANNSPFSQHKYHDYLSEVFKKKYGTDFDSSNSDHVNYYNELARTLNEDFSYLDSIEKYKGTSYYDTLYSNPHLFGRNETYKPTGLESLGDTLLQIGTFGASGSPFSDGGSQRYRQDLLSKSNSFLTETIDKYRQEVKNDAVTQAQDLRNAGQNPDLTGGISAGQASENDQPIESTSMPSEQDSGIMSVVSFGMSFLQSCLSTYSSLQSIAGAEIDNEARSLSLSGALEGEAWNIIKDATGYFINNELDFKPGSAIEILGKDGENYSSLVDSINHRIDSLPYNNKNKRKLKKLVKPLIYTEDKDSGVIDLTANYENLVNNLISSVHESRNKVTSSYGLKGADEQSQQAMRFIGMQVFKPLNDLLLENQSLGEELKKRYQSASLTEGLPELRAGAEGANYLLQKELKGFKNKVSSRFNQIERKLHYAGLSPSWELAIEAGLLFSEGYVYNMLKF